MAESSVFPDVVAQNGHSPETTPERASSPEPTHDPLPLPHFDAARKVFTTSRGNEIEMTGKPISAMMLERVQNQGKPRIPQVEVTILGKHKQMQANPKDPGYLALLDEWDADQKVAVMRYLFVIGVKGSPPPEFAEEQRAFFPDATDADMKYLWVGSLCPDEDLEQFTAVILGRSIATEAGLQESAATFPGQDQRDAHG